MDDLDKYSDDIFEEEAPSKVWLLSFTDVIALMLTFFVMLFSMSNPKVDEWNNILSSFESEFNFNYGSRSSGGAYNSQGQVRQKIVKGKDLNYLYSVLNNEINANKKDMEGLELAIYEDRVTMSLNQVFLSNDNIGKELKIITKILKTIDNDIDIYGYLDKNNRQSNEYLTGWGEALVSSYKIAKIINDNGYSNNIRILGTSNDQENQDKLIDIVIQQYTSN